MKDLEVSYIAIIICLFAFGTLPLPQALGVVNCTVIGFSLARVLIAVEGQ